MVPASDSPNIYVAFSPIFYISKLFAIMPFTYNRKRSKVDSNDITYGRSPSLQRSNLALLYAVISLVVTIIHGMSAPVYVLNTSISTEYRQSVIIYNLFLNEEGAEETNMRMLYDKDTKQSMVMKILNPLLVTLMCLGIRVVALLPMRMVGLSEFFVKMQTVDTFLKYIDRFDRYINDQTHRKCALISVLYFAILSLPINLYYLYSVSEMTSVLGIVWCVLLVWSNLTSFCGDIQFIFCGYLIKIRFKLINDMLKNLSVEQNELSIWQLSSNSYNNGNDNYRFSDKWCFRKEATEHMNAICYRNKLLKKTGKYQIADSIEIYRYCHRSLCELVHMLNSMYKLHLLLTLASCFLKSLFNIYFTMFGYAIGTASVHNANEQSELFRTIWWNLYYIVRFLTLTSLAHSTAEEGVKTKYMVSALNNRFLDSSTKEELTLFSNYISNTKIEFTACDFFTLNTHLITSAIAAGTTYLVILVQFHSDKD